MDSNRVPVCGGKPIRLTRSIVVNFHIIAARYSFVCNVISSHLCDVNTPLMNIYVIGQRIGSPVFAIHQEVNHLIPRCPVKSDTAGHFPCHRVAHQSLITKAINKYPFFRLHWRLVHATLHHMMALTIIKLNTIGFVLWC